MLLQCLRCCCVADSFLLPVCRWAPSFPWQAACWHPSHIVRVSQGRMSPSLASSSYWDSDNSIVNRNYQLDYVRRNLCHFCRRQLQGDPLLFSLSLPLSLHFYFYPTKQLSVCSAISHQLWTLLANLCGLVSASTVQQWLFLHLANTLLHALTFSYLDF